MNVDRETYDELHRKVNRHESLSAREGELLLDYTERLRASLRDLCGKVAALNVKPSADLSTALANADTLFNEVI
jgi:hypothetical protein